MKNLITIWILFLLITVGTSFSYGQHRPHAHRPAANHPHHQPVHRSHYRPATVVIYHPHWAPHREFHRRWVYFPKHKLYWDNWRELYFFYNGTAWVSSPGLPPHLVHLKLENEKHKELKESVDDDDEIYLHNK
jgi:hypothetical protein